MATIQGLEATIRASRAFPGKYWISGGASQGLDKEGEWTPLDCWTPHYHDDGPAAQAFIEQHADKPATPAAEVAERADSRAELQRLYQLITAAHKSIVSGNLDANTFEVSRSAWLNVLKKSNELPLIIASMPPTPADGGECERLRGELAAARADYMAVVSQRNELQIQVHDLDHTAKVYNREKMQAEAERDAAVGVLEKIASADHSIIDGKYVNIQDVARAAIATAKGAGRE